jgi:hypothetical protein
MATTPNTIEEINDAIVRAKAEAAAKAKADAEAAARATFAKSPAGKALKLQLEQQLVKVKTQADIDRILAEAKDTGVSLNQGAVDRSATVVKQLAQQEAAAAESKAKADAATAARDAKVAEADQIAQAKAAADAAAQEAQKQQAAQIAQQTAAAKLGQKYDSELVKATTQEQVNEIQARAAAEGATLNQGYVDAANRQLQQAQATAQATAQAQAQSGFETRLAQARTTAELQSILAEAQTAGVQLNSGLVERAQTAVPQLEQADAQAQAEVARRAQETQAQAAQQAQTAAQREALKLGEKYTEALGRVTTQAELDAITAQAQAEGATLNQGYLERAQTVLGQTQQRAQDAEQSRLQQEYNSALLNANTPEQVDDIVKLAQQAGVELNQGYVDRGREIGTQTQARAAAEAAAAEQARIETIDFVQNLPPVGSEEFEYLRTNQFDLNSPDGGLYKAVPANLATGAPAYWAKSQDQGQSFADISGTGPVIPASEITQQIQSNNAAINQQAQQQRADLIASQQDQGLDFGDFLTLVAVAYIAAVALPYITSAFSGAGAAAGAGASEAAATAAGMAAEGATAAEISTALQAAGFESAAATAAAEAATGIATGAIDVAAIGSSITPEAIAMANASLDPIAALNAAQGWTAVDTAYLATIGVPASVMATAEATNVALGLDPTGLNILTPEQTAALESNIDPDMINRIQPVEPVPGAETPYRVEVSGAAGTAEAPSYAIAEAMTPGSQLATTAQIDAGLASWNPAANAWEVGALSELGAVAPAVDAVGGVASSAINPATGLLETVTPGFGTSPVASVALSAPEIAAAAIPAAAIPAAAGAISPGVLAGLAGGAAALAGLAGGGSAAGAAAIPTAPVTPAPVAPAPTPPGVEVGGPITQPPVVTEPLPPLGPAPVTPAPAPVTPAPAPVTPAPAPVTPAPTVPTTPLPGTGGTTVFNPGTGLYETTIPAGPGGVAEVVLSPTPPAGPAIPGPTVPPLIPPLIPPAVTPPVVTPPPVVQPPLSPLEPITTPPNPPVTEVVAEPPLSPLEPVTTPPSTPIPEVVAPGAGVTPGLSAADLAKIAAGWVIVNGILTPPAPPTRQPYGPLPPVNWGSVPGLVNPGLNPGYMVNPPTFYNTTSPVQSKFNYTPKAYQPGPVFDPLAYNNVPGARATPWGLQQLYTPTDINTYLAGSGPVAPRV